MGRLIDADIALERFIKEAENSGKGCIHINTIKRILQDIDTAYDVEKVVEQIHEELFVFDIPNDICDEIVKRGGVK